MTFVPDYVSSVAGAFFYDVPSNLVASVGTLIKPQSVDYFGNSMSAGFGYNSSTGVFTLDSNKKYLIEADLAVYTYWYGYIGSTFYDSNNNELPNVSRGVTHDDKPEQFATNFTLTTDETTMAIVDGSTISSFTWKVSATATSHPQDNVPNQINYNIYNWARVRTRLIIKEY